MSLFSFEKKKQRRKAASLFLALVLAASTGGVGMMSYPLETRAAVNDWKKGAAIVSQSTTDLASDATERSLDALRATGANYVAFVIPVYQSNIYSTDIGAGWNTPTMASLAEATRYAHSIGLAVQYKLHPEVYTGEWRANIDPWSRAEWFDRYKQIVLQVAGVASQNNVEMISLGTELVRLASDSYHSENTWRWNDLIAATRGVYGGQLTYGANSTYQAGDQYTNEKDYIRFWDKLDYASLSPYYNLDYGSSDVESLKRAWDYWNQYDIKPFYDRIGKPILFGEIGYRSVNDAYKDPWNWSRGGNGDQTVQANAYEALLSYWNSYPYLQGIFWWDWPSDLSRSQSWDTNYYPSGKSAEGVLKRWFGGNAPALTETAPLFTSASSASPRDFNLGTETAISLTLTNSGGTLRDAIVDIEVYRDNGEPIAQKLFTGETLAAGASKTYEFRWKPSSIGGYIVRAGVFSSDWRRVYHWLHDGVRIAVATEASGGSGGSGGGATTSPTGNGVVEVWWPTPGARVSGTQPFKAMLQSVDPANYFMSWRVDGDRENEMWHSDADYPHKESLVDLGGWNWKGSGPYTLTFTAKDARGSVYGSRSLDISIDR